MKELVWIDGRATVVVGHDQAVRVELYSPSRNGLLLLGGPAAGKTASALRIAWSYLEGTRKSDVCLIAREENVNALGARNAPLILEEFAARFGDRFCHIERLDPDGVVEGIERHVGPGPSRRRRLLIVDEVWRFDPEADVEQVAGLEHILLEGAQGGTRLVVTSHRIGDVTRLWCAAARDLLNVVELVARPCRGFNPGPG